MVIQGTPAGSAAVIRAAGVVISRTSGGRREFAVIHRPHRADWTLPKGKLDPGETWPIAAVREVLEETGIVVTLGAPLPSQHYTLDAAPKEVRYWRSAHVSGEFVPNAEADELRWLAGTQARELLSYDADRDLVTAVEVEAAEDLVPLIVIRHAHAGDRASWTGADDGRRPLSPRGRTQLPVIEAITRAYGVTAILTSPASRCVQTVEALKEGLQWQESPWLYEGQDVTARGFRALLEESLAAEEPLAICTHGDLAPWLASHLGANIPHVRKGGVFIAWHRPGSNEAIAHEYYDTYPENLA